MFTNATKDAANETLSDAKATAYSAKNDIERKANNAGRDAGSLMGRVANDVERAATTAGRKARDLVDSANDQFNDKADMLSNEIRSNPIRSSAFALGLGFVIGALFRR